MNILYIACSCSPYHGSEDKIGWNIPLESAKYNKVFVITRESQRKYIEQYTNQHKVENISFYYVGLNPAWEKFLSLFPFTVRLNLWHRKSVLLAEEICRVEHIDVIHQITPIEFRSIGNYGKIPNVKFVCGPLGGGQAIPKCLMGYMKHMAVIEHLRNVANYCSLHILKYTGKIQQCDYLLLVNQETLDFLRPIIGNVPYELCFDNGICRTELEDT